MIKHFVERLIMLYLLNHINRNLDPGHQDFIMNSATANIGVILRRWLVVILIFGGTIIDFKNTCHGLKTYVLGG